MAIITRFLSRPILRHQYCISSFDRSKCYSTRIVSACKGSNSKGWSSGEGKFPAAAAQAASAAVLESRDKVDGGVWGSAVAAVVSFGNCMPTKIQLQHSFERAIVDCRFLTFLAVGGSLLGSILCFLEGCFMIVRAYIQYIHALSLKIDHGLVLHILIEAIDMFIIGIAMLVFGMGLYVMFVGSKSINNSLPHLPQSNFFPLFTLQMIPSWMERESVIKAKTRVGQAVMLLLQVGTLGNFTSLPLVSPFDLSCFAAALFFSSASVLLLSLLHRRQS